VDHYHIWVNLRDSHKDLEFASHVAAYMGYLQSQGLIEGHSLERRKLGFGPPDLGEFHIDIRTKDLAQLEKAFSQVATRDGKVEELHGKVYGAVTDFRSALYRDFPDAVRVARRA
jgi:uncharacterized protein DUF6614